MFNDLYVVAILSMVINLKLVDLFITNLFIQTFYKCDILCAYVFSFVVLSYRLLLFPFVFFLLRCFSFRPSKFEGVSIIKETLLSFLYACHPYKNGCHFVIVLSVSFFLFFLDIFRNLQHFTMIVEPSPSHVFVRRMGTFRCT